MPRYSTAPTSGYTVPTTNYGDLNSDDWQGLSSSEQTDIYLDSHGQENTPANVSHANQRIEEGWNPFATSGNLPQQEEVAFEPIEFDPIAYSQEVAAANKPQLFKNIAISFAGGRKIAATNTAFNFEQFNKYLDSVMPGITTMQAQVSRNIESDLNFVLPPQLQAAGVTASAEQSMAAGVSGTEAAFAVERYNLTQLASDRELQARQDAMKLFGQTYSTTQSLLVDPTALGKDLLSTFNNYTLLTPAQASSLEMQKLTFNATGELNTAMFNSGVNFNNESMLYNDYWMRKQMDAENNAGAMGSIGSLVGMGLGALFAAPTGGLSLAAGAAIGGAVGGAGGTLLGGGTGVQAAGAGAAGAMSGYGMGMGYTQAQVSNNLMTAQTNYLNNAAVSGGSGFVNATPMATPTGGSIPQSTGFAPIRL